MSTANQPRTRSDLVAGLRLPPGQLTRSLDQLRRGNVLLRIGMAAVAALLMWGVTFAWTPPLRYRAGFIPPRDVAARAAFSDFDPIETRNRRALARRQAQCYYVNDKSELIHLRTALKDSVFEITDAASFDALNQSDDSVWSEFSDSDGETSLENEELLFNEFRAALRDDAELARFERAVQGAFAKFEQDGLLTTLDHDLGGGSQISIMVHAKDQPNEAHRVEVRDVRIPEAQARLKPTLRREFEAVGFPVRQLDTLTELVYTWISKKGLPRTLSLNKLATQRALDEAASRVEEATIDFHPGDPLATRGQPLTKDKIDLLRLEHRALTQQLNLFDKLWYSMADLGMFVALYVLCGTYIYFHHRRILNDVRRLTTLLGLVVATVALSVIASNDQWRAELIPLVLFGMTITIAYQRELALMLSAAVALVVALSLGQGLDEFVIHVSAVTAGILLLGRIRSRTKLIYVGLGAATVAALTTIGVGTLAGQSYGWSGLTSLPLELAQWLHDSFLLRLLMGAAWFGFTTFLAGVVMTGLLPFIERLFDVQTDISLLELGDAAHPLLQELVRRAPGTYNHSITVATIAEAAADAVGGHGLLARVGAYFHDIGKMLKPGYFIENQSQGINRHDTLLPAMSTLVIIAHVKDGADLARQHGLPQSIIDFIDQHHGTTLVEYFYREAAKQCEENPDSSEVDESSFRYPGPKPQTREAGVLMLADAAESICRSLVDPGPSRIEHVVSDLVMKRLMDGQFDECGLTFRDLRIIEDSLVKSLTAVYHGRVKYPSQQPA